MVPESMNGQQKTPHKCANYPDINMILSLLSTVCVANNLWYDKKELYNTSGGKANMFMGLFLFVKWGKKPAGTSTMRGGQSYRGKINR